MGRMAVGLTQKCEPMRVRVDAAAAARGKVAAAACAACHGVDGRGDRAKLVPGLAGQPPGYLASQIRLFREERRSPGDEALMHEKAVMKSIPDATIDDLAAWHSSLR